MSARVEFPRPHGFVLSFARYGDERLVATLLDTNDLPGSVFATAEPDRCYVAKESMRRSSIWIGNAAFDVTTEEAENVISTFGMRSEGGES